MNTKQNQASRAKVYVCYTNGMTPSQTQEKTELELGYINRLYMEFSATKGIEYTSRLAQIKHIEKQLFWAIENSENNQLISRLQNSYARFVLNQ